MALKRFKTDRRWWFWISLVLFVVPWFLTIWDIKGDKMMPAAIWFILVEYPSHLVESLIGICYFSLFFGVPAIAIGWVLHCLAVMVRHNARRRREHAA